MPDGFGFCLSFSPRVRANGVDLVHQRFGSREDPAILLIAGLGAQMTWWDDAFCTRLAATGLHVVRFDNRDAGRSTWCVDAPVPRRLALLAAALHGRRLAVPYTLDDMADDCAGLLDALGLVRAHVVGASLGAAIGQALAIRHPARVTTLTSMMGMSGNLRLLRPRPDALALLFARAARTEAAYVEACRHASRVLRAGACAEEEPHDEKRARLAWRRGHNPAGRARQFAAFLASGSRAQSLRTLSLPALVVHGARDPLVPLAAGEETAALIPGARLAVIEGMGHALSRAHWGEVVDRIAHHAHATASRSGPREPLLRGRPGISFARHRPPRPR